MQKGQKVKAGNIVGLVTAVYQKTADGIFMPDDFPPDEHITPTHATVMYTVADGLDTAEFELDKLESAEWWVNVYKANRAKGGNEEGGWWYDCGEIQYWERFDNKAQAETRAAQLRESFRKENESPRADLNSILCTGRMEVYVEETQGRDYPDRRPHYE